VKGKASSPQPTLMNCGLSELPEALLAGVAVAVAVERVEVGEVVADAVNAARLRLLDPPSSSLPGELKGRSPFRWYNDPLSKCMTPVKRVFRAI